jgi:hypothetical protein
MEEVISIAQGMIQDSPARIWIFKTHGLRKADYWSVATIGGDAILLKVPHHSTETLGRVVNLEYEH